MTEKKKSIDHLISSLQERAKELNCLYKIDEILKNTEEPLDQVFLKVIDAIPPGWQYSDVCQARISFEGREYHSKDFVESEWSQSADIVVDKSVLGTLSVYYAVEMPPEDHGPFLLQIPPDGGRYVGLQIGQVLLGVDRKGENHDPDRLRSGGRGGPHNQAYGKEQHQ